MPGFSEPLGLERLSLILQFIAGLLLLEAIFTNQVLAVLRKLFQSIHKWIGERWRLLSEIALFVSMGLMIYASFRVAEKFGLSFWKPSLDWWHFMREDPATYWSTAGIILGIGYAPIIGTYLLLGLIYVVSAQLSRAPYLRRTILALGIVLAVSSFVIAYIATLMVE